MKIKRFYALVAICLAFVVAAIAARGVERVQSAAVIGRYSGRVIIVDAGHGGFDGGAVADDGTVEKDINLSIALKIERIANAFGFNTVMVRRTDTATDKMIADASAKSDDLKNRLSLMEKYPDAIYLSIHQNKYTSPSPHGAQIFYSPRADGSDRLADELRLAIIELVQPDNERLSKPGTKDMYLLYNATVPAVIVECGFISNSDELIMLKNEEYQQKLAFAIVMGVIGYYK